MFNENIVTRHCNSERKRARYENTYDNYMQKILKILL